MYKWKGTISGASKEEVLAKQSKVIEIIKKVPTKELIRMEARFREYFIDKERSIYSQYQYRCLLREFCERDLSFPKGVLN